MSEGRQKVQVMPGSSIGSGTQTVAAAGTPVQLTTTSTPILSVAVKALHGNTGMIYVGGPDSQDCVLDAGEPVSMDVDNLTDVWIDADVNGEGVSYLYLVE